MCGFEKFLEGPFGPLNRLVRTPVSVPELRSYVPHTKTQNPSEPKIHPEMHPQSPSKTEMLKNTKNLQKSPNFVYFWYFFSISVLEGDLGCISGCIGGVLYFVWETYDHNPRRFLEGPFGGFRIQGTHRRSPNKHGRIHCILEPSFASF